MGLADDVVDAQVDVQVQDLGLADAPPEPTVATAPPLSVSPDSPSVRVTVGLPTDGGYAPGLLVRVRGRTSDDGRIEFFDTGGTPLHGGPAGPVQVVLSRIS